MVTIISVLIKSSNVICMFIPLQAMQFYNIYVYSNVYFTSIMLNILHLSRLNRNYFIKYANKNFIVIYVIATMQEFPFSRDK